MSSGGARGCAVARPRGRTRRAAAVLALALACLRPAPARAGVEEFSTFSVLAQENDDESLLDHLLTRAPRAWDDQWARATGGIRTSQGCLTSGEWFIDTDFKARAPLGNRAWFGADFTQSDSDILSADYLDLSFHFPQGPGSAFAMFRPSPEKAAQDFALGWEAGADTSAFQMRATWTFEDVFNNFWAFRQSQVGALSEPYEKRPYEPALSFASRHKRWRAEAGAKWLTPSRKRIADIGTMQTQLHRELWGTLGHALVEADLGRFTVEARSDQRQARGHDQPVTTGTDDVDYRRQWSAEGAVRTLVYRRATVELRYIYQDRMERFGPQVGSSLLRSLERLGNLDVLVPVNSRLTVRVGGLYDRIGVTRANTTDFSWGSRKESRAYISLQARFGRVQVAGVEGIELDSEPYPVTFHHDKGFLQLQTTF